MPYSSSLNPEDGEVCSSEPTSTYTYTPHLQGQQTNALLRHQIRNSPGRSLCLCGYSQTTYVGVIDWRTPRIKKVSNNIFMLCFTEIQLIQTLFGEHILSSFLTKRRCYHNHNLTKNKRMTKTLLMEKVRKKYILKPGSMATAYNKGVKKCVGSSSKNSWLPPPPLPQTC